MIASKCRIRESEVDGAVVVRQDPLSDPMLFSIAPPVIRNDTHVTFTYPIGRGLSTTDVTRQVLERALTLNPTGKTMSIRTTDTEIIDSWRKAEARQLEQKEYEKWYGIAMLMQAGNKFEISNGP
jgi:hypothetical protein